MIAAAAIKDLIERCGLSKAELCRRSGISRALLDGYLNGRRQPGVGQLERLGAAVGLRPDVVWLPARPSRESSTELSSELASEPSTELASEPSSADRRPTPRWARPHPDMAAQPLTVAERALVLERVVDAGLALQRNPKGDLEFPPFRYLRGGR